MAVLTKEKRSGLPSSEFAGPGRTFPIPDKIHAEKALQLSSRSLHAGNITAAQKAHIDAKARKMLNDKEGGYQNRVKSSMKDHPKPKSNPMAGHLDEVRIKMAHNGGASVHTRHHPTGDNSGMGMGYSPEVESGSFSTAHEALMHAAKHMGVKMSGKMKNDHDGDEG